MKNKLLFFAIAISILMLNFSSHILSTLSLSEYFDEEFPSERYVISRLAYNLEHDMNDHGGLLSVYKNTDEIYMSLDKEDYYTFKQNLNHDDISKNLYPSHSGLQDDLINPIWQGLNAIKQYVLKNGREGSRWVERLTKYDIYYFKLISQSVVSLVNALVLSLFLLWVVKEFSIKHGWVTLALIMICLPVLSFYGRSMWWMMWSWFLPFVMSCWSMYFFSKQEQAPSIVKSCAVGVLLCGAIALKTMMGYEFLSTILVAALIPVTYYAIYHRWGLKPWFTRSVIISFLCLVGVLVGFLNHVQTLENAGLSDPLSTIMNRFEMRAYGGEGFETRTDTIAKSTRESLPALIGSYLFDPRGYGIPQILFMVPLFIFIWRRRLSLIGCSLQEKALLTSIALGFIGALTMLIILKGHAYIHGYDIVVWSIPMNILLCLFYAHWLLRPPKTNF